MKLIQLNHTFGIYKLKSGPDLSGFENCPVFYARTKDEISLVCPEMYISQIQNDILAEENGYAGFYIDGILDFSLTGILADLSTVLAKAGIPVFAVSTFDTDYIFIRNSNTKSAIREFIRAGWEVQSLKDE